MKERPILFSGEMVRAILDGRKTQTRRMVEIFQTDVDDHAGGPVSCPYGVPGDRLWVRETWGHFNASCMTDPIYQSPLSCFYRADESSDDSRPVSGKWRPSIHMPHWASRINLEITGIRCERLNDISRGDAMAEGCPHSNMAKGPNPVDWYRSLWESINGPGSWDMNPFVWVVEFKKLKEGGQ